jgi:hypothetical protein
MDRGYAFKKCMSHADECVRQIRIRCPLTAGGILDASMKREITPRSSALKSR